MKVFIVQIQELREQVRALVAAHGERDPVRRANCWTKANPQLSKKLGEAGLAAAARLAERIKQAVADHLFDFGEGDTVRLSCSIGFAFSPFMSSTPDLFSWEQVLDVADRAMYRAKQAGRNRWVGVLSAPGTVPAIVMMRKDDDLERLSRDGIVELHTTVDTPASVPDHTARYALTPPHPQLVHPA